MRKKFKKGAASFYIVAFSTLILIIIAMSFAALMIAEITRTSNNDLSQSAYDSALAGVEDGKLAIANYNNCKADQNKAANCSKIIEAVDKSNSCNTASYILGRTTSLDVPESAQVIETDTTGVNNNMEQYYTCVKINSSLEDYKGTLSSTNPIRVVRVKFDGVPADNIGKIKVSWTRVDDKTNSNNLTYSNISGSAVQFKPNAVSMPPTISLAMIQTAEEFTYEDFESSRGNETDRGMLYLVPTRTKVTTNNNTNKASEWDSASATNKIGYSAFVKSNDKKTTNLPYTVYCPENSGTSYLCSALIEIPKQIGERRSENTFTFVVALPYGGPTTDFALEFFCADDKGACYTKKLDDGTEENTNQVNLGGVQIEIDSTGKANDLYRRVQARVEGTNNYSISIMGPLELLGSDKDGNYNNSNKTLLEKDYTVLCEHNFYSGEKPNCDY